MTMKRWLGLALGASMLLSVLASFSGCTVEKPTSGGEDKTAIGKDLSVVSFTELYMDQFRQPV